MEGMEHKFIIICQSHDKQYHRCNSMTIYCQGALQVPVMVAAAAVGGEK